MAPLRCLALASFALGQVVAQSDTQRVWAAVAFVNHGETTPQIGPLDTILTPEGAQQLFRQGSSFRSRYLSVNSKESDSEIAPIRNISQDAIDNIQITALSQAEEWIVAGATAFFQGMYPGNPAIYNDQAGGMDIARNYPEGDNITDYPLNGYQYARIQTFSMLDKQYPSLQGTTNCRAREAEIGTTLVNSEDMRQSFTGSLPFYKQLFDSGPLEGLIETDYADYWKAYEIYDLVKYMYTHNITVFNDLERANDTLATLEANAAELETALTSPYSDDKDDETNALYTIAGRTLAAKIEAQFLANIARNGQQNKLTMMFGSHVPLMSFFNIANIKSGNSKGSDPFSQLPQPGAAMVFELISDVELDQYDMPDREDLRVRFLYRASADADEEFKAASLFGSSSAEQGLPWSDFSRLMVEIGVSSDEWCSICQPEDAAWCNATGADHQDGDGGSSGNGGLDPAVAGAIGAVVTLAFTAILGLALFFIFGFRLQRAGKDDGTTVVGGFKGSERMPDDKDVAISKGGARHERVGSWELRDGPGTPPAFNGAGIVTSDFHRHDDARTEDDAISVAGARVVNTRESV